MRPGREISPLDRWALKEKSTRGDADFECEEEPKGKCGAWWHEPNANPWMHCMRDHASKFCPWMVVQTAILMGLGRMKLHVFENVTMCKPKAISLTQ